MHRSLWLSMLVVHHVTANEAFCTPPLVKWERRGVKHLVAHAQSGVPDMPRRALMNSILLYGGVAPVLGGLGVPFVLFFIPKGGGNGDAAQPALDKDGNAVTTETWRANHGPDSRALVQGLNGEPTYLLTDHKGTIESFGVNAVCTHLGCVVPWNAAENKFMCPCHGSQYNEQGRVVRGPAPLSLALVEVETKTDNAVSVKKWKTTDFRTNEPPWWI